MRSPWPLIVMGLAACGDAPAVQPPPSLGTQAPCTGNAPPPGYAGPVSPHAGPCPPVLSTAPRSTDIHDYSQGAPPRAVRGQ